MKNDLTDIVVVLDKSGSMDTVREETISGFNEFLQEQKKAPGDAKLTLVLFDSNVTPVHSGTSLQSVEPLSIDTYVPSGMTALHDAVMRSINETGNRLASIPEEERPGKIIFVIMTDGQENSSREFRDPALVRTKIRHQEEKYSWNFVYIGANQDAFSVGGGIGIRDSMIANYMSSAEGTSRAFRDVSRGMTRARANAGPRIKSYFKS